MQLNDVKPKNSTKIAKINKFLSENFKFKVNVDSSVAELKDLKMKVMENTKYLKTQKGLTPKDAEFAKNLSILEAVDLLIIEKRRIDEDFGDSASVMDTIVATFYPIIAHWYPKGVTLDSCIDMAMREYRSSPFVVEDSEVENTLRQKWSEENPGATPDHTKPIEIEAAMPVGVETEHELLLDAVGESTYIKCLPTTLAIRHDRVRGNILAMFNDGIEEKLCRVRFTIQRDGSIDIVEIVNRDNSEANVILDEQNTEHMSNDILELIQQGE